MGPSDYSDFGSLLKCILFLFPPTSFHSQIQANIELCGWLKQPLPISCFSSSTQRPEMEKSQQASSMDRCNLCNTVLSCITSNQVSHLLSEKSMIVQDIWVSKKSFSNVLDSLSRFLDLWDLPLLQSSRSNPHPTLREEAPSLAQRQPSSLWFDDSIANLSGSQTLPPVRIHRELL